MAAWSERRPDREWNRLVMQIARLPVSFPETPIARLLESLDASAREAPTAAPDANRREGRRRRRPSPPG